MNDKIKDLYNTISKHSHYQKLYKDLEGVVNVKDLKIKNMYEDQRWAYLKEKINFENKNIVDIGGNTGYFTFSIISEKVNKVIYFEGNESHAEFVTQAANLLKVEDKLEINNTYITFENISFDSNVDVVFLLNVVHHLGDDYGDNKITEPEVLPNIAFQINSLAFHTKYLVLQIGYNWKGIVNRPLFKYGTKLDQIEFLEKYTDEYWFVEYIGIANGDISNEIIYEDKNDLNIVRNDSLGEFLNRPIFILKSLKK